MKNEYELIDFGNGNRLEKWGEYILIRPDLAATGKPTSTTQWTEFSGKFESAWLKDSHQGVWTKNIAIPEVWPIQISNWKFLVGLGSTKQLGIFPEQLGQWQEIDRLVRATLSTDPQKQVSVLNGFAYTGAASIVATLAGAKVTHIDSNGAAIGRAKENQALNGLSPDSIRWIKDDVLTFMQREVKREKKYDVIILDPPAFGHGPKGEIFSLTKHLAELLALSRTLLSASPLLFQLTTYTDDWTPEYVKKLVSNAFEVSKNSVESNYLELNSASGKCLITGVTTIITF